MDSDSMPPSGVVEEILHGLKGDEILREVGRPAPNVVVLESADLTRYTVTVETEALAA